MHHHHAHLTLIRRLDYPPSPDIGIPFFLVTSLCSLSGFPFFTLSFWAYLWMVLKSNNVLVLFLLVWRRRRSPSGSHHKTWFFSLSRHLFPLLPCHISLFILIKLCTVHTGWSLCTYCVSGGILCCILSLSCCNKGEIMSSHQECKNRLHWDSDSIPLAHHPFLWTVSILSSQRIALWHVTCIPCPCMYQCHYLYQT